MRLHYKILLGLGTALVIGFATMEYRYHQQLERSIEEGIRAEARLVQGMLMATRRVYQHWFLEREIPINEDTIGFLPAYSISRISRDFANWNSDGLRFNNVSDRARNPSNQADAFELEAIAWFRAHPDAKDRLVRINENNRDYYHYTAPIWTESYCLDCHGERDEAPATIRDQYDGAYGYQEGDLRGVISVRLPLEHIEKRVRAMWMGRLRDDLVGLVVVLVLMAWLLRLLVTRKLRLLEAGASALSKGDYQTRVVLSGQDELTHLGDVFNHMAEQIAHRDHEIRNHSESLQLFRNLMEQSADAVLIQDVYSGRMIDVNLQAARLLGYSRDELLALSVYDFATDPVVDPAWQSVPERVQERIVETRYRHRDGSLIPVEVSVQLSAEGGRGVILAIARDIRERRKGEERLRQAAKVFESTSEGVTITDRAGRILEVNQAFSDITGYLREEVIGMNPRLLKSGRHDRSFYQAMWQSIEKCGRWNGEIWNRRKGGEIFPEWLTISAVTDSVGSVSHYVAVFSDISTIKQSEQQLDYLAHHDPLTELPNRLLFNARLEHAMQNAERQIHLLALIVIDLDHFKHVNDSLGHQAGDQLLQEVAARLPMALNRSDTLARLGGDEFAVILENITSVSEVSDLTEKLFATLSAPCMLGQHEVYLNASAGITMYPRDGDSAEELLKNADAAVYRAKQQGRDTYCFFTEELAISAYDNLLLGNQLRRALENSELELYYQPQYDALSGRLVGAEALLRWNHPKEGLVMPNRFIELAERNGLIIPIGRWVLQQACTQAAEWSRQGIELQRMAVNLAAPQITRDDIYVTVRNALETSGLEPSRLDLEITERMLMGDSGNPAQALGRLRGLGVGIAIDDFGTGYSSLSYLKRLPVDSLKIDRSFVSELPTNEDDAAITQAIIALGHSLKLRIIAEGVETHAQRQYLQQAGCDWLQGYLLGRPVTATEFTAQALSEPYK